MAGGSLGSLTIDLAANITRFERSLTRAEQLATKRSKSIQRTFTRMAAGLGAALVSFGFVRAVEQSLEFADSIGKTADKLGIATSALQEYRFAAEQTGVAQTALDVGLQRFSRRVAEAAEGTGVLFKVLKEQNIALRDNEGNLRSTEDVLDDYADAIMNAGSSNEQLLLAFKAFDTEGVAFVNTLKNGATGLNEFRQEARDLGIILSDEMVRNAEDANDKLNALTKVIKINLTEAILALAPHITSFAEYLTDISKGAAEWSKRMDSVSSARMVGEIEALTEKIELAQWAVDRANQREDAGEWDLFGLKQSSEEAQASLDALEAKLLEAELRLGEINLGIIERGAGDKEKTPTNFLTGKTPEEMQADFDNAVDMGAQFRVIFEQQSAARLQSEQQVNSMITASRMQATQNAVGFLQVLGQKSKTAAMAALVVQKGLAIAQTIISTQAASMRAMAELGPIAGPPAVAQIQAMGAASVGLIAATGLLQASNLNSGAASGVSGSGTIADPTFTSDVDQFNPSATGTTGTITINVNGVVTEEILQDLIIPAIQDATNDKDVILFRSDSRQAIELEA